MRIAGVPGVCGSDQGYGLWEGEYVFEAKDQVVHRIEKI